MFYKLSHLSKQKKENFRKKEDVWRLKVGEREVPLELRVKIIEEAIRRKAIK